MKSSYNFEILRHLRKQHGLTIEELAKKSRVSFAVISKLERNQTNPGLDTIKSLADAFGIAASEMISMAEIRPNEIRKEEKYQRKGVHFRSISFNNAKIITASAKKGQQVANPEVHENDSEILYIKEGRLKLSLPTGETILKSGESLQFDALFSHSYEILEDSELIIIHLRKPKRF